MRRLLWGIRRSQAALRGPALAPSHMRPAHRVFSPQLPVLTVIPARLCASRPQEPASDLKRKFPKLWRAFEGLRYTSEEVEHVLSAVQQTTEEEVLQVVKEAGRDPTRALMDRFRLDVMVACLIARTLTTNGSVDLSRNARLVHFEAGEPRYEELIRSANLPKQFTSARLTFDLDEQRKQLGRFSKRHAVVPFFEFNGKKVIDMRFADVTGTGRTPESTSLQKTPFAMLLYTSASGKTSTIFNTARHQYTIYVACRESGPTSPIGTTKLEDQDPERTFHVLMGDIEQATRGIWEWDHAGASQQADRLIAADICARVAFLSWYMDICGGSPEEFLMAQLGGGQEVINALYLELRHEPQEVIADIFNIAKARLRSTGANKFCFAVDEAQIAATKFTASDGFSFAHKTRPDIRRGLLYEYVHSISTLTAGSPIVVAGTGLNVVLANELPSYMGKPLTPMQPLPVLKSDDVRARLSRMLEVSEADLDKCKNLHMLQGRPRWSASVVNRLPETVNDPYYEGREKHEIIDSAIASVVDAVITSTVNRLTRAVDSGRPDSSHLTHLLQQLYTIYHMFEEPDQGIRMLFETGDLNELLRIGLGQVAEPPADANFHKIALDDFVSREVVCNLGLCFNWSAVDILTARLKGLRDKDLAAGGVGFETVCAAALCAFDGTVADLVKAVAKVNDDELPEWTKKSQLGGLSFDQVRDIGVVERMVKTALASGGDRVIAKIPNDMRTDLFGILKAATGPFLLLASAKFRTQPMSAQAADEDFRSTSLDQMYKNKDGTAPQKSIQYNTWQYLLTEDITPRCGKRALRSHFALTAGFANRKSDSGPGEGTECQSDNMTRYKSVHVNGDEVRLIIDDSNYKALFKNETLTALIEQLKDEGQSELKEQGKSDD